MRNKFPTRLLFLSFGLQLGTLSAHIPFMHICLFSGVITIIQNFLSL